MTLEIRGLRKVHPNGFVAVDGIDLTIADQEFFVIVGPSGCGKTSVLRMVAGLDVPTSGDITVDGTSIVRVPTHAREVGMLFQAPTLYPHLSVRANLAFPLVLAAVAPDEIERRVERIAGMLGLRDALDDFPSRLSGGQRQRVAMGRAIVREPSLLLMDEPMSNLDAKLRTELRSQIALLCRRLGMTTLYVTHDQVEAMSLGDRAAVMRNGRVVQCATPEELYETPADVFVAGFIGTPPMNLLAGVVVEANERLAVRIGSHVVPLGAEWGGLAVGRRVVFGCRPESLRPDPHGPVTVAVVYAEHLGPEALIHCSIDAQSVSASVVGLEVLPGATSTIVMRSDVLMPADSWRPLRLAVDELQLFDAGSGLRIPPNITNLAEVRSERVARC